MRELDLLSQYLIRLRQEKLLKSHRALLDDMVQTGWARVFAHEAELCDRIRDALKVLAEDPAAFIEQNLKERKE